MDINTSCPICRNLRKPSDWSLSYSKYYDAKCQVYSINCERCGEFKITHELIKDIKTFDEESALKLSWTIRDNTDGRKRRRDGTDLLLLKTSNWRQIAEKARVATSYTYIVDAIIQCIGDEIRYPGRSAKFSLAEMAARVCLPNDALVETLRSLSTVPLIVFNSDLALQTDMSLSLKGWERFDTLRSGSRGDRAFVAMWFDQSMNEAYKSGIEPALVSCGYQPPFRVDDPLHDKSRKDREYKNRIDDRILAEIRRARFVVADASGARPSVYYEAGFADGLGIPVIWCCRKDDERKIAFDTRQNAHILWESPNDLKEQLENKIRRFGWIPNPK